MAWGARSNVGIEDLVARVAADEPTLTALALLPSRRFGAAEADALAAALRQNTRLRELHLGGRSLSAESAGVLAEALIERATMNEDECVALRALSVGDASFGCGGASALAPVLSRRGVLCGELDLELRGVGAEGARALSAAVAEARRSEAGRRRKKEEEEKVGKEKRGRQQQQSSLFVQSLNLARNPSLGDAGAEALSEALFGGLDDDAEGDGIEILTSLDLSDCGLSSDGVASLAGSSRSTASPLVSLRLERNAALCPRAAESLAAALEAKRLSNLERLSLSGCALVGDNGAAALAKALSSQSLRSLDLSGCGVGEEGAKALAGAIGSSTGCSLLTLRLGGGSEDGQTRIGNAGASALGLALRSSSSFSLKELDLSSSGITCGDAAASLLSPGSSSLESLTLAGNALGDQGALAVAAALLKLNKEESNSSKLQHLDLAACGIGLRGAVALADALLKKEAAEAGEGAEVATAPNLRTLVLGGNPATDDDAFASDVVARLREARPELDVAWRSADQHAAAAAAEKK